MTDAAPSAAPPPAVPQPLDVAAPCEIAIGVLTYENAATVPAVVEVVRTGLERHFPGVAAALINADAGSSDATPDLLARSGLPLVRGTHETPPGQRAAVPFHGVPGRGAALRLVFDVARRLGARGLVLLEADVPSVTDEWLERLLRPVLEEKADLVLPAYARHRYDGTLTNLLLAPLVRALFGRRLHQPVPGAAALSARLLDRLATDARWPASGRHATDLWIAGTTIAGGFAVWETWLGRRRVESRTRTTDLPTVVAEVLGGLFEVMDRYGDLWLEVGDSEPVPATGAPAVPAIEPVPLDVERMIGAFRRGVRDLGAIWEHVLAPETYGDVLALDTPSTARFDFPDELWVRAVYDFALGHHYRVVYREHLLRSFVPLYLGRTAAFVLATRHRDAAATDAALDGAGAAFERQKPYLLDRWR
jgi:hypothetical protein